MQKLITKVALFRFGVRQFTEEVNLLLADGWNLDSLTVDHHWLKIICVAVLSKHENQSCCGK